MEHNIEYDMETTRLLVQNGVWRDKGRDLEGYIYMYIYIYTYIYIKRVGMELKIKYVDWGLVGICKVQGLGSPACGFRLKVFRVSGLTYGLWLNVWEFGSSAYGLRIRICRVYCGSYGFRLSGWGPQAS